MCIVSMVVDHYNDKWWREISPSTPIFTPGHGTIPGVPPTVTLAEFLALKQKVEEFKKEFEDMKELLKRAKIYDEVNNQPDCESDEKLAKLEKIVTLMGMDFEEVKKIIKSTN